MKIAIYTGTFKKNHDGVARATYQLVDTLLSHNHQVLIGSPLITPQNRKNLVLHQILSIPVFFYPDYRFALPEIKFFQQVHQFKPDIVHIATPDGIGLLFYTYAKIQRLPIIFIHHSDIIRVFRYYGLGFLQKTVDLLYRFFYRNAVSVYTPSKTIKNEMSNLNLHNLKIWSRGINMDVFNYKKRSMELRKSWGATKKIVILYTGRLVWYKDLDVFVEVYKKFQNSDYKENVKFVLVGDGPIRKELEYNMPNAIFMGYLHDDKLGTANASGDIFLFPSTTETFGQVVQEALASGLPAIVSNIGGCQDIIKESNAGTIVPAKNSELFFRACLDLVNDPILLQQYRANAIKFVSKRSWAIINSKLISEYEKVIQTWQKLQKKYQTSFNSSFL